MLEVLKFKLFFPIELIFLFHTSVLYCVSEMPYCTTYCIRHSLAIRSPST